MKMITLLIALVICVGYFTLYFASPLTLRKVKGIMQKPFSPGYSSCYECGRPWKYCNNHSTMYGNGSGVFVFCQECWLELTPSQRLPYYEKWFMTWHNEKNEKWNLIKEAVLEGK